MTKIAMAIIFLCLALLVGYRVGYKAAHDIAQHTSDAAYIEQYLSDHEADR